VRTKGRRRSTNIEDRRFDPPAKDPRIEKTKRHNKKMREIQKKIDKEYRKI
jgi:hypothetical protein